MHSVYYMGPYRPTIPKLDATNSEIREKMPSSKLYIIKYFCTNIKSYEWSYATEMHILRFVFAKKYHSFRFIIVMHQIVWELFKAKVNDYE